ncbi:MAG: phosphoribosyltransferase family protein [Vibrio sp.]
MPQPCTSTRSCPCPLTCQYNAMVTFSPSISIVITFAYRQDKCNYPNYGMMMLIDWLRKTTALQQMAQCPLCRLALDTPNPAGICTACQAWLAHGARCQRCGLPSLIAVEQCGQCLRQPPAWHTLICVGDYRFPLSDAVHQLKYQRQFWQAPRLAQLLAAQIEQPAPLLCSVPLHWRRRWQRGFNQSDLLARALARTLATDYDHQLFSRRRATPQQQGLSKTERLNNLQDAFQLNHLPRAAHVAIVDDVVTTGSTLRHLCALLLDAGVQRIDIYCLCRTPEPKERQP